MNEPMLPSAHLGPTWHILQMSGPLDAEFASALAELAPVTAWEPRRTLTPWSQASDAPVLHADAGNNFTTRSFPLLRGYAKPALAPFARTGPVLAKLLGAHGSVPGQDVLVCTVPYFAPVAERWPGPVVYWLTDAINHYPSSSGIDVPALDRRMCRAATLLCPNSARLRDYLVQQADADPSNILIVPNATRQANVFASAPSTPAPLPAPAAHLQRPVVGVVGNLAGNLDWLLLDEATQRTPDMHWLFVGPTDMAIPDEAHRHARQRVLERGNTLFVGRQPYGDLAAYARSFDVAVLPYRKCEPTYSGSSTRFYEHLAACRPMLATRGFEELLHKEPYLKLVDTPDDLVNALHHLAKTNFEDGYAPLRWQASLTATWQARAAAVRDRLHLQQNANRTFVAAHEMQAVG